MPSNLAGRILGVAALVWATSAVAGPPPIVLPDPLFPPTLPSHPSFERIAGWAGTLTAPEWTPEVRVEIDEYSVAQGKARWTIGLTSGLVDCNTPSKQGVMVVEKNGQTRTGLRRFRGGMGACGPAGHGILEYADGRIYIGEVANSTNTAEVSFTYAGHGLWIHPDGRRVLVQTAGGVQSVLFAFGGSGEWWAQGAMDAQGNAAQGIYTSADGARFEGPLREGRPGGMGTWRFEDKVFRITGSGELRDGRPLLTGPIDVVLHTAVAFGDGVTLGAGRYAFDAGAGWAPGAAVRGALLRPYADSLGVATSQPDCPLQVSVPRGWRTWAPSCVRDAQGNWTVDAWSPDGRYVLTQRSRDGHRIDQGVLVETQGGSPLTAARSWTAARFEMAGLPEPVGETQYTEGGVLRFVGPIAQLAPTGSGFCALPAEEGEGLEPCQFRAGQRVDELHHLRRQRALQNQQLAAQQAAQLAAAQRAEQERLAQLQAQQRAQAQQQQSGGFQWGKLAALGLGAAVGGIDKLDANTQANILTGIVKDSMGGAQGLSNFQSATQSGLTPSIAQSFTGGGASGGGAAGGKGAVAPGSYPARPNTLDGHPACSGYSVENYKEFYAQNSNGPDAQLHALCAGAYNYYWMYLNAIRQGYAQHDSDRTYAAFSDAARVATSFYDSAR